MPTNNRSRLAFRQFLQTYGLPETKGRQLLASVGAIASPSAPVQQVDFVQAAARLGLEPAVPVGARAQQLYPDMAP